MSSRFPMKSEKIPVKFNPDDGHEYIHGPDGWPFVVPKSLKKKVEMEIAAYERRMSEQMIVPISPSTYDHLVEIKIIKDSNGKGSIK